MLDLTGKAGRLQNEEKFKEEAQRVPMELVTIKTEQRCLGWKQETKNQNIYYWSLLIKERFDQSREMLYLISKKQRPKPLYFLFEPYSIQPVQRSIF
jgi:hypothetical protein